MKILKIFGIVVGIHVFALILIFANPGCSSTTKPAPQPEDTVAASQPAPMITMPAMASPAPAIEPAQVAPAAGGFNPDAPATYAGSSGVGVRFTPTRPNTAAATAVQSQPVENVTPATTYVVKAGDSLWTLQKRFHINLKEIAAANNLRISAPLHEGQKLIIPTKSGAAPAVATGTTRASASSAAGSLAAPKSEAATTSRPTSDEFKYTVKPGETLGMIARKFDVKIRDLAVHNNISDPRNLRAGSELSIPGWKPAAGSSKGTSRGSSSGSTATSTASTPAPEPAAAPNLLEPSPSEPASTPSSSVPVINLDENTITPAPAPKS